MVRTWQAVAAVVLVLAGCVAAPLPPGMPQPGGPDVTITPAPDTPANASASARTFISVVSR
ncbi:peptidase M48, partial [Paracoccus sp. PXZ]